MTRYTMARYTRMTRYTMTRYTRMTRYTMARYTRLPRRPAGRLLSLAGPPGLSISAPKSRLRGHGAVTVRSRCGHGAVCDGSVAALAATGRRHALSATSAV
jgi:hypothetical protein